VSTDAGRQGSSTRGWLRIYLGYAPGAGTTCALLGEGRQRAEHGTDVVVAGIETQGRPGTKALLADLEVISPPTLADGGTTVEEIDPGAILARSPRVAAG
jgi:two-component system sensor histidine kinase KdpD